jgi:phosphoribosyl-AMP cyclohydrolase
MRSFSKGLLVSGANGVVDDRENGTRFMPKFDAKGLLTAVVIDAESQNVLMVAHMNAQALAETRASGFAHFYSRSRQTQWKKGETSGNVLAVTEILVDCDQDALVLKVKPAGPACHTGAQSCFYRLLDDDVLVKVTT